MIVGLLGLAACASKRKPEALYAPQLELHTSWFRGLTLHGPLVFTAKRAQRAATGNGERDAAKRTPGSGKQPAAKSAPLRVRCEAWFVRARPAGERAALSARLRLISSTRGGAALESSSRLLRGVEVASGDEASQLAKVIRELDASAVCMVGEIEAALPEGTTLRLHTQLADARAVRGDARTRAADYDAAFDRFSLELSRRADRATVASVHVEGHVAAPRPEEALPGATQGSAAVQASAAPVPCHELAVLADAPISDATPLLLVLPAARPGAPDGQLVIALRIDSECRPEAVAAYDAAMRAAEVEARDATAAAATETLRRRELEVALAALELARERPALIWLAGSRGAKFAGELALVADDRVLAAFAKSLVEAAEQERAEVVPTPDDTAFAWAFERTSLRFVIARAQSDELEPELRSILLERVGELGRYPGSLETILRRTPSLEVFERTLVDENRLFLEDRDPAARVRAFDWLAKRDKAPAGFDPLADKATRKAVLARIEAETEQREQQGSKEKKDK